MSSKRKNEEWDAGSRMHVLDWVESPLFISDVQALITTTGLRVDDQARRQPRRRGDHRESVLTGDRDPFLTETQKESLLKWWLVHRSGAKLPTWDLVVTARTADECPALVLFEAKAHISELSDAGKEMAIRAKEDEQNRTRENHEKIAAAIQEASRALDGQCPGIALTHARSYQFANRIAFAWKLATMGIPVALVYLGFLGDDAIAVPSDRLNTCKEWKDVFMSHAKSHFPECGLDRPICCGPESFWVLCRSHPVLRPSPPINERRIL